MNSAKISISAWLAAVLLSVVIALPWIHRAFSPEHRYVLAVDLTANTRGIAKVFFDYGEGFKSEEMVQALVTTGGKDLTLRFPLRAGNLRAIRFDPLDRPAELSLRGARILDRSGRVLLEIAPNYFRPVKDVTAYAVVGSSATFSILPGSDEPALALSLAKPLPLPFPASDRIFGAILALAAAFVPVALGLVLLGRVGGVSFVRAFAWMERSPGRALACTALVATALGSYPVIFLGKSFVSPNYGTSLLYDTFPSLPGYDDMRKEDVRGSDAGAVMWAHLPLSFTERTALLSGELPLWNRYGASGTTLLGQGQSMFGDPLHFFVLLAGADAWTWDVKYLAAKFLFAFGMGLLAWRTSRHLGAATVIAGSSVFIGFYVYRINHPAIFSLGYAPWILVAWLAIADAPHRRALVNRILCLLLANWSMLNSGTVKEAYMFLGALNCTGALALLMGSAPIKERLGRLALVGFAGATFLLLSAPVWLTFLDALRQSYSPYNTPTAYQIQPSFMLGLFDEIFYRPLQQAERVSNPSANFVVLIGFLYLLPTWRCIENRRLAAALALAAGASLLLVFGVVPPQWIQRIPFLGNVSHIDNCFSLVLIVLLGALAALGWRHAFARLGKPEARADLAIVALFLAGLVGAWIATTQAVHKPLHGPGTYVTFVQPGTRIPVSDFVWTSLAVLTAAALGSLFVVRAILRKSLSVATGGLLLLACGTLLLWRHGQHAETIFDSYVNNPPKRAHFFAPSPAVEAVRADRSSPFRVAGVEANLTSGWTSAYALEGISGADALINTRYLELTQSLGLERYFEWQLIVHPETFAQLRHAYDFLGVRYYFDYPGGSPGLGQQLSLVTHADLTVYRSETTWPRAFFTDRVETYTDVKELVALLHARQGKPFAAMIRDDLPDGPPFTPRPERPTVILPEVRPATNYRLSTNDTAFTVDAPSAGFAVLHEAWVPDDFTVTLNGNPAEVLRINHAFKGVRIPSAGKWQVEFKYWPKHFTQSIAMAVAGVLALAGLVVWGRLPGRLRAR